MLRVAGAGGGGGSKDEKTRSRCCPWRQWEPHLLSQQYTPISRFAGFNGAACEVDLGDRGTGGSQKSF